MICWRAEQPPEEGSFPKRKQFTPVQKAAIIRRYLVENAPVYNLCDE